jgi:formate/nitrite transporter
MRMALQRSLVLALSALVLSASGLQTSPLINKQASPLINKRQRTFAALATTDGTFTESVVRGGGNNDNFSLLDTPADAFFALATKGEASAKMSVAKTFSAAILGGLYVGVGGMLSLAVCGNMPGVAATNPGLVKLTFAALFPVALFLCLQGGAQLFTGNTATMSAAYFEKRVTLKDVLRNWVIAYGGNLIGCAGFAAACSYSGVLTGGAATMAANTAIAKTSMQFGPLVVRAILCNWLVCLAVFCAAQAKDMMGKYIGILLPISAFVAIGFEHSVANMFLLPAGLLAGAPVRVVTTIVKNFLPVTLGNAIAGVLMVGAGFSWQFGRLGEGK